MRDLWDKVGARQRRADRQREEELKEALSRSAPLSVEAMLRGELGHVCGDPARAASADSLPALVRALQAKGSDERPVALCLSGGGIRSATFCLGVLQWLAGQNELKNYHYLSTVSGGGYIGSWLVNGLWQAFSNARSAVLAAHEAPRREAKAARDQKARLIASSKLEEGEKHLQLERLARERDQAESAAHASKAEECRAADEAGNDARNNWLFRLGHSAGADHAAQASGAARVHSGPLDQQAQKDPLAALRAYSNYLSPSGGLSTDAFSLVAIFLRNLLLNLLVWLPLIAAWVSLPRHYIAWLTGGPALHPLDRVDWWPLWLVMAAIVFGIAYIVADLPEPNRRRTVTQPTVPSDRFNPACFLPITAAAIVLSLLGGWTEPLHKQDWWWFAFGGAFAHLLGVGVGVLLRKHWRKLAMRPASYYGVFVVVLVGAAGGALTWVVLSQLGQGAVAREISATQRLIYASLAVPAMTGAFWLAMSLHAGLMGRVSSEDDREWWARATAAWLKFTLIWVAAFAIVVWAQLYILDHAADAGLMAVKFGVGGSLLGVLTSLIGYWSQHGSQVKSKAQGIIRVARLKLLDVMAGLVLLSVLLTLSLTWSVALEHCNSWSWARRVCADDLHAQAEFLRDQVRLGAAAGAIASAGDAIRVLPLDPDPVSGEMAELGTSASAQVYALVLLNSSGAALLGATSVLLLVACLMAWRMGTNQFSLHGMYGNRLVRAYLGTGRPERQPHWFTGFDPDDNPKMCELRAPLQSNDGHPRLYPLVNIALNLVKPSRERLDWQQRKAASFIATPLHCGAAHIGFRPTEHYAGGMSLGRAMTISGAAASPNMGYHSSPLVTFVMSLFNVRLGWWSPNVKGNSRWSEERAELGLDIMWAEATGATGDEDRFVHLSDGGHFDNTGIYEMVRRRCRRIVAVDATCDGEYRWTDLIDTVRKIRVDLGIPILLPAVLPGQSGAAPGQRFLTACIQYSARDPGINDGELVVLKPLLLKGQDPPELVAYARDSAREGSAENDPTRFPHQSTADQFFDEQQFESYRLLGYVTAKAALGFATPNGGPPKEGAGAPPPGRLEETARGVSGDTRPTEPSPAPEPGKCPLAADVSAAHLATARLATGASGVGQFVQQMGTSAALAAALTVGGTLGVAGSVALQPAQVSLSDEDRALLHTGLKGQVEVAGMRMSDDDRRALQDGVRIRLDEDSTKRLMEVAQALDRAIASWPNLPPPGPRVRTLLEVDSDTRKLLEDLRDRINKAAPSDPAASQPDLTTAISQLQQTLAGLKQDPELKEALRSAVEDLKKTVRAGGPRQNIRGQDGGTR